MKKDNEISVLITGLGGGGVGEQVLKALKIAQTPYHIAGTDMSPISMGLYQVDKSYIVPCARDNNYISIVTDICEKEKVRVLIPCSEPELIKISENRNKFDERGILLLINQTDVLKICMDKWEAYNFLVRNSFDCPRSLLIDEDIDLKGDNIENILELLPVVIKPALTSGGSANVFLAQDREEVEFFTRYLRKQGLKTIIQEYVGSYDEEYTVGVLTDVSDGSLIGSIAVRRQILSGLSSKIKIRNRHHNKIQADMLVISSGVSQGIINDFPDVRYYCEKIALKLNSKGPLNIQCRKAKGKVYAFEINPRFSGTTFMRAMLGYNEPDILIRKNICGENTPSIKYKRGIIVRGLSELYIPPVDNLDLIN